VKAGVVKLTDDLVELVSHVASPMGAVSAALRVQASAATVTRHTPTMIDLAVPDGLAPVDLADGPLPVEALIHEGIELLGEIIVWVRAGHVTGIEQAWYTDDPPSTWPKPARVQIRGESARPSMLGGGPEGG